MLSGNLPDELVVYILTRLPPKNLIEFTPVSKAWYFLIKSSRFIKTHLNRSLANPTNGYLMCMPTDYSQNKLCTLLCSKTLVELGNLELPFECDMLVCTVVGSVNGLICVADSFDGRKLYLCNPATRKYKDIGYSSSIHRCVDGNPYVLLGFAYHPQTNDYKVIRIMYLESSGPLTTVSEIMRREVEVYRSNRGSWGTVGGDFEWTLINQWSPALVNGNLHWVVSSPEREIDEMVLSFDLGDEVFREITLPNYHVNHVGEFHLPGSLCVFKESLSLFAFCPFKEFEGSEKCYLWVMKEYGNSDSWTKQFTINLDGITHRLLGITRLDEIVLKNRENKVVLYDLGNHQTKYSAEIFARPDRFDVVPLIESLLFVEGEDGVSGQESSFAGTNSEGTSTSFNNSKKKEKVLHSKKKRSLEADVKTKKI